jgi:hypothetical protein
MCNDMRCTCNVTLRHFHATIVAVEKQYHIFCVRVFVVLVTQRAMRLRHIVVCGLPRSTIFNHIIS